MRCRLVVCGPMMQFMCAIYRELRFPCCYAHRLRVVCQAGVVLIMLHTASSVWISDAKTAWLLRPTTSTHWMTTTTKSTIPYNHQGVYGEGQTHSMRNRSQLMQAATLSHIAFGVWCGREKVVARESGNTSVCIDHFDVESLFRASPLWVCILSLSQVSQYIYYVFGEGAKFNYATIVEPYVAIQVRILRRVPPIYYTHSRGPVCLGTLSFSAASAKCCWHII